MGSGYSGLYIGTIGSSQPYAPKYGVLPEMKARDREIGVFGPKGYISNPTTKSINEMINGRYIGNKRLNGIFIYAITTKGEIVIGKRNGNGFDGLPTPHPTLIGGRNPKVKIAGLLDIRGGKIFSYDHMSGHFKPNRKSMKEADEIFSKLPEYLFHKKYRRKR